MMQGWLPGLFAAIVLLLPSPLLAGPFDHNYSSYDALLRAHVDSEGLGAYDAVRKDRRLAGFLKQVAEVAPEEVLEWSREQQVAFFINAYNALTVDLVADHFPISSIRDLDSGQPWKTRKFTVAGQIHSLDGIQVRF